MGKQLNYKNNCYTLGDNESVLDCLLREDLSVPHSCKSGVCQSCIMQAVDGEIPEKAQLGLKPTFKQRKLFLACQCYPLGRMTIANPDEAGLNVTASINEKIFLNHNVIKVCLKPEADFECEPGQYLTLINPEQVARSYSIANNPAKDGFIELHIRLIDNGLMSEWLKNAAVDSEVILRGPAGNCFYSNDEGNDYPIILAGTGTGLAPLYGIAHEAIAKGHNGEIKLFHGALNEADLYLIDALQELDKNNENFTYVPCVLNGEDGKFYKAGDIQKIVMENIPADKAIIRLFLCGAPEMVNSLKTKAFLGGLSSKNIYADAFLPSK
jgi:NAD(P)H-flavin reductase/ferredoxin